MQNLGFDSDESQDRQSHTQRFQNSGLIDIQRKRMKWLAQLIGLGSKHEGRRGKQPAQLYVSRSQVLRYASGDLKGFRVGLAKTAAVQIARSSMIEFGKRNQGRTITYAEIDQWLEE